MGTIGTWVTRLVEGRRGGGEWMEERGGEGRGGEGEGGEEK